MKELEFLIAELDKKIQAFDKQSTAHKKLFRKIKILIFIFTGLSTVLAGIAIGSASLQPFLNVGVVIFTSAIGIASSYDGLRNPGDLWRMERNLFHALNDLKRSLEFDIAKNQEAIDTEDYFNKLQILLNSAGEKWSKNISKMVTSTNK